MNWLPEHWTQGCVEIPRVSISYYRTGGNKPILLLLHGLTDSGLCWTRVARNLEVHFDIIMPDARGHGKSVVHEEDECTIESLADDTAAFIQALGLKTPLIIMGHSMGGQTATYLAAKYPKMVSKVILEDPAYHLTYWARLQRILILLVFRTILVKNQKRHLSVIEEGCRKMSPNWDEMEVLPWAVAQKDFSLNGGFHLMHNLKWHMPWRSVFAEAHGDILILTSEKGALSARQGKDTAWQMPTARAVHIKKAGHSIRRENYKDFMNVVRDFLGVE